MTLSPITRTTAAFGIALTALACVGWMVFGNIRALTEDNRSVAHSHRVLTELEATRAALLEAETVQRSYLITGEAADLQRYTAVVSRIDERIQSLRTLTTDNPGQQSNIATLEHAIQDRHQQLQHNISLREQQGMGPVRQYMLTGIGRATMEKVRVEVSGMQNEESRLLYLRDLQTSRSTARTAAVVVLGSLLSVAVLALAFSQLVREIAMRQRTEAELRHNADRLAAIVAAQQDLATAELDADTIFQRVVRHVQEFTQASGAVLELVDGDEMVYRAASGTVASSVGLRLQAATSLSGLCVRTGELLRCEDSETDPRVDLGACRKLGARSMVVTPLQHNGTVTGVLKILAPTPRAFSDWDVRTLQMMAESLAGWISNTAAFEAKRAAVTALQETEAALRQKSELLHSILQSMDDGVVVADTQGNWLHFNPAAERILGRGPANTPSDGWAAHFGVYLPDRVTPYPTAQLPLVRAIRGECVDAEEMLVRHAGLPEGRWIQCTAAPLLVENEEVAGGIAVFHDVTERKQAEEEIRQLNEDLQRHAAQVDATNKEMEAFSYSVSHDLRAPLRSIDGFSLALMEDYADQLDANGRDYLQRVRAATQRMGQLIDDMLTLSRVTRGEMRRETVDLSCLAQEVVTDLQQTDPDRAVDVTIAEGLQTCGDARLLKVVLTNLLGNAWKFTAKHDQARIEFGEQQREGEPVYFVRDDGAGFDARYADKLFGAFQRLHAMTEFSGTGVGLATVARIIHRHGGRIWAEGAVEQGATFYFTL